MKVLLFVTAMAMASMSVFAAETAVKKEVKLQHTKEHAHVDAPADHAHDDAHHKDHDHKAHHPEHKDEEDMKVKKK